MSRITAAFQEKRALIAFITGGDPDIETTKDLIPAMAEAGADIIEIGIPFSDPIAEGPAIQAASLRALTSGTTVDKLFDMVQEIRQSVRIPLLFMTYANPVFAYGTERFLQRCSDCGIDGLIIPDVPYEEKEEFSPFCKQYGITLISQAVPAFEERATMIAASAEGFVYCMPASGTANSPIEASAEAINKLKHTVSIPCAVEIDNTVPEQGNAVIDCSDGLILGNQIVKIVDEHKQNCIPFVKAYLKQIKKNYSVQ